MQTASGTMRDALLAAFAAVALASAVRAAAAVTVAAGGPAEGGVVPTPELVKEFNRWINGFLFSEAVFEWTGEKMGPKVAHYFLTWVRNFLGGSVLYYVTAACWHW